MSKANLTRWSPIDSEMHEDPRGDWMHRYDVLHELQQLRAELAVARQSDYNRQLMLDKANETIGNLREDRRFLAEAWLVNPYPGSDLHRQAQRVAERVAKEWQA